MKQTLAIQTINRIFLWNHEQNFFTNLSIILCFYICVCKNIDNLSLSLRIKQWHPSPNIAFVCWIFAHPFFLTFRISRYRCTYRLDFPRRKWMWYLYSTVYTIAFFSHPSFVICILSESCVKLSIPTWI